MIPLVVFPRFVDVDGDGRPEILARDAGPMPRLKGYRGVRLIEGATGATRWRIAMSPANKDVKDRVVEVLGAPDLDGDGVPEIVDRVGSSSAEQPEAIYVDMLSGKDGRRLWSWNVCDGTARDGDREAACGGGTGPTAGRSWRFRWEGRLPVVDSEPLLDKPLAAAGRPFAGSFYRAGAASGDRPWRTRELRTWTAMGWNDLWGEVDGELRAFRGEAPEAWRALGRFDRAGWPLAQDAGHS